MTGNVRANRIDAAVSAAGELIGALLEKGPITPQQARTIVEATVRAAVPNFEDWEVRDSATRIVGGT
jgi:polyhydroxyalkanoate synthesis regulator phasin